MCEVPLDDWANGGSVDVFFTYGEFCFSSMEIQGQNCVALLQGSKMSADLHSRSLILGMNCFTVSTMNV